VIRAHVANTLRVIAIAGAALVGSLATSSIALSRVPLIPTWASLPGDMIVGVALGFFVRQRGLVVAVVFGVMASYPIAPSLGVIPFLGDGWWLAAVFRAAVVGSGFLLGIVLARMRRPVAG